MGIAESALGLSISTTRQKAGIPEKSIFSFADGCSGPGGVNAPAPTTSDETTFVSGNVRPASFAQSAVLSSACCPQANVIENVHATATAAHFNINAS
jgi:hypothetical protein